jgi:hypothetical protein
LLQREKLKWALLRRKNMVKTKRKTQERTAYIYADEMVQWKWKTEWSKREKGDSGVRGGRR